MKFINKYLRNLSPYKVASHKVWEVTDEERDRILKLDWNEATIPPSPLVQQRLLEFVSRPNLFALYPSTYNETLLEKIASYCGLPMECIQYFASSDALHEYMVRMYVSVGDPVLIVGPTYDNFRLTSESQGAKNYFFELSPDFSLDAVAFETAIDQIRPSLIYLCSPNNPTGGVVSTEYIERLLNRYTESIFLLDEAYFEFCDNTAKDLVLSHENLFISRTFSKAFALANFRAGYLLSAPTNVAQISKIRNPKNFTSFTQEAVIAALSDLDYMKGFVREVNRAKAEFIEFLTSFSEVLTVYPSYGNFVLIQFKTVELKLQVLQFLETRDVYVRNLTHSALLATCLRVTIGTRSQMNRVMSLLEECISRKA